MFTDDIFNRIEQLLKDDSVDIAVYDGEFFDPDKLIDLQKRYSTKDGYMMDIESVEVVGEDSTTQHPRCRFTCVVYAIHSNKRAIDLKVKGSMALAATAATKLVGQFVQASTDHGEGSFRFFEIQKEDQIPYVSVHAMRVMIDLVIAFVAT